MFKKMTYKDACEELGIKAVKEQGISTGYIRAIHKSTFKANNIEITDWSM